MVNMQMVHELRIIFDHINMPCALLLYLKMTFKYVSFENICIGSVCKQRADILEVFITIT